MAVSIDSVEPLYRSIVHIFDHRSYSRTTSELDAGQHMHDAGLAFPPARREVVCSLILACWR